jgi:hypothetical protein
VRLGFCAVTPGEDCVERLDDPCAGHERGVVFAAGLIPQVDDFGPGASPLVCRVDHDAPGQVDVLDGGGHRVPPYGEQHEVGLGGVGDGPGRCAGAGAKLFDNVLERFRSAAVAEDRLVAGRDGLARYGLGDRSRADSSDGECVIRRHRTLLFISGPQAVRRLKHVRDDR